MLRYSCIACLVLCGLRRAFLCTFERLSHGLLTFPVVAMFVTLTHVSTSYLPTNYVAGRI